ncbi:hypothetical protein FA15DRAFT_678507 [Coprinopsis marcescibilis]|uniref:Alginate lyase domain-containing protein n=1 Tax=Coprinopsis marcescibilis TaxID=230819 RepID=A0A5C3L6K6_COPMA|nr:hypothetical protein FA15DRAFT_678507 [Coprinopsis marcescibilis]
MTSTFLLILLLSLSLLCVSEAQTSYANEFVDPDYILNGNFPGNTASAQKTIGDWATKLAADGPWSVTSKDATPPSGTKHDYMSWAPYWWPDCSEAGNSTALPGTEVWTMCRYVRQDGKFNPDIRNVNDVGNFQTMTDAVFYNAMAWALNRSSQTYFSRNAVRFIQAWFLDENTRMNPNLNYAQMIRGSDGRPGSPTGVLDLKGMAKIASAILILRRGNSPDWTSDLDDQMVSWAQEHTHWLETSENALAEGHAENNHGSFYYNQLAGLKLIVNDIPGAINVTSTYFSNQFASQMVASGEQPLEAARTRPYHYRAYNIAAMITNARIEKYANPSSDVWNRTSSTSATIKTALDYAMTHRAADSGEAEYAIELYPNVAAVASVYGDESGTYLEYLRNEEPGFYGEPYFMLSYGTWAASEQTPLPNPSPSQIPKSTSGSKLTAANGAAAINVIMSRFLQFTLPLVLLSLMS